MSSEFRLVRYAIDLALFLGAAGCLLTATYALGSKAMEAHQVGLISLGKLNRQLVVSSDSR